MQIQEEISGSVLILSIDGRVEMITSPQLKECVTSHINQGQHRLLFDLAKLEYISSPGLGVLLFTAKLLQEKSGKIAFCCLKAHIMEVFKICGFERVLPIFQTRDEALASFN